jgi:hypothetical protein
MTQANEPPNAENHAGQEEQASPSPISRPRAMPDSCFGLIMGAVALLALLGLLSAAWWYIESAGWFDLKVNITIANEKTHPSGEKIDARVGEKVILNVKSDTDDEIHAHVASNYKLPVQAGKPAKGSFILDQTGSFIVESHHCDEAIVILNVR